MLIAAIKNNDIDNFDFILATNNEGILHTTDASGGTLLHIACKRGNYIIFRKLLEFEEILPY